MNEDLEAVDGLCAKIIEQRDRIAQLEARVGVLELALRTAARRFSFMAGVGWINGVDPAVGYNECVAALQPEEDK